MALEQFKNYDEGGSIVNEVPAEDIVKKEEPSKESLYANDAALRLHQKRAEYDKHLQTLIDKASQRQTGYNPKLMALGAGLLTPGKTGSFFEGLGTGTKGYMEAGEQEQKDEMERAKLENELRTGQIGQLEKDYALEQELQGDQYMRDIRARRLKQPQTELAVSDLGGKPSARSILGQGSISSYGSGPGGLITQDDIMAAPKGAQKRILEDYKRQQDDLKISQESAKSTEVSVPFLGTQKISIQQQQDISRIVNSPQYQALPPADKQAVMRQYYADNGIGEVQPEDTTTTKVAGAPDTGMETATQKQQRLTLEGKAGEEMIKADADDRKYVKGLRDNANGVINSAQILYDLASNPKTKEAFGVLQKGGIINSILGLAEEGIGGEALSIRIKGIEDAARKLTYTDSQGKPVDPNKLIKAVRMAQQQVSNLSLGFAKVYLQGQGAVSDNERRLVEEMIPNVRDPASVIMPKAELLKVRAMFDRDMGKAAMSWINKDPLHRTIEQYKETDDYRNYVDRLNADSTKIIQTYFPNEKVSATSIKEVPTSTGSYADIIRQEKERRNIK
jgi:hypothetical protein